MKKNTRLVQLQFGPTNLCTNHTTSPGTTLLAYKLYSYLLPVLFKSFVSVTPYYTGHRHVSPDSSFLHSRPWAQGQLPQGWSSDPSERDGSHACTRYTIKYIGGRLCGELTRRQQASPASQVAMGVPTMEHSVLHTVAGTGIPCSAHNSPSDPAAPHI
jgi:hypothetical protein